jgi:hypothetical protein
MMRKMALTACLLLAACGNYQTFGHDFNIKNASKMVPGVSTDADAAALFGKPTSVTPMKENNAFMEEWTFAYYSMGVSQAKHLSIMFDHSGKMIKIIDQSNPPPQ